jgi:hypothetical protein
LLCAQNWLRAGPVPSIQSATFAGSIAALSRVAEWLGEGYDPGMVRELCVSCGARAAAMLAACGG